MQTMGTVNFYQGSQKQVRNKHTIAQMERKNQAEEIPS